MIPLPRMVLLDFPTDLRISFFFFFLFFGIYELVMTFFSYHCS